MVQWKGKLQGETGQKARKLEQLKQLNVPNFFVITPKESKQLFKGAETAQQILNTELEQNKKEEIKNAFREIGMSSEVRKAAGKAKSLVGGQRNNSHVSVRISNKNKGKYEYRLDIGSSNLFKAIKEVAASYVKENNGKPAIIIQKMVEPKYTGAIITQKQGLGIIEAVEGLGHSLEQGKTRPHTYFIKKGQIQKIKTPENCLKITRNPINGQNETKKIRNPEKPFSKREALEIYNKIKDSGLNVKFAYKRGNFHIVDVWREDMDIKQEGFNYTKVSPGTIKGVVGRQITYSGETLPPEKYEEALVAEKGGYISTDAQKARQKNKKAIFNYDGKLEQGQKIHIGEENDRGNTTEAGEQNPFTETIEQEKLTALEVLPINPYKGRGLYTSPPFGPGYKISREKDGISEHNYLESCEEIFKFKKGSKAVVDTRKISKEALKPAIKYLESEFTIVIIQEASVEQLLMLINEGVDVFAAEERFLQDLKSKIYRAEKKFILEKLREK